MTYTYDANDRILSVCFLQAGTCPGGSDPFIRWTYDKVGNRLTEARPTGTTNYSYNALDELTQAGSTAYTYDADGNDRTAGSTTLSYDLANRLKTLASGGTTTTYSYDGDGNRLQASTGNQASKKTNYLWDTTFDLPQLALERDGNNALLRRYLYGARRISMFTGGASYYYHYDTISSVRNVTSSTGVTQWTDTYEPYGAIRTETKNQTSAPTNFMKFTGEYNDPTGLYYLRARQYDTATGRFTKPDPASTSPESPALSSYVYAGDRPTVMVDPSGMTFDASDCGLNAAQMATSQADVNDDDTAAWLEYCSSAGSDPKLTRLQLRNARIIWTLARDWGLGPGRAREMVGAALAESRLGLRPTNPTSGAAGLFQLFPPYTGRAAKLGGVYNSRANTCAILPNYAAYWSLHKNAGVGQCASVVEASNEGPAFYAPPSWLPHSFKLIAVQSCPRLKPFCAPYFAGTRYAYPHCQQR